MKLRSNTPLLNILLANEDRASAVAQRLSERNGWTEAVDLAREWRVAPQLLARARGMRWDLPAADSASLKRAVIKAYGRTAFQAAKAIEAVRCLDDAGIRVAAFKGVAAIALLYGKPEQRAIHDADLLIAERDLEAAIACLERHGFKRRSEESLAAYIWFVDNAPGFTGNKAVTLYGSGESEIDLHWDLGGAGLQPEEILARAGRTRLMGAEIPAVHPADGFLLTVHHAIRENLAIETVFRDLLDITLWCDCLRQRGELTAAMNHAAAAGNLVSALAVAGILREYHETSAATEAAAVLGKMAKLAERRSADRLAELFHYQLDHGRLGKDVLYLVHTRPWRQILRGLGRHWIGYRRSQRSMEDQLGELQPWRKRASLLAKAVPGFRGLQLARELARVKYGTN